MARLNGRHIKEVIDESLTEIDERRLGLKSRGLKTGWKLLDKEIGGGIQERYNYLLASLSGSGKSTISNILETEIMKNNPDEDIAILNFNFETIAIMNLTKKYSSDMDMTVSDIFSAEDILTEEMFNKIKEASKKYENYEIYYFDEPGTAEEIRETILAFRASFPDKILICLLDHTGLVEKKGSESDLELMHDIAMMSIKTKKEARCSFIWLGQLNSNIEKMDRLMNAASHVPMRSDLFGPKSLWNAMDVIFMPHRPDQLLLSEYTTRGLPTKDMMYFHIKKQRFGSLSTIQMDCSKIGLNKITEIQLLV